MANLQDAPFGAKIPTELEFSALGRRSRLDGLHVVIDGYNLALSKGTGVATYARNLSQSLGGLGCKVDVLYGAAMPAHSNADLNEVVFFDSFDQKTKKKTRLGLFAQGLKEAIRTPVGVRANEIQVMGHVILRQYQGRMPHFDRILNARDLFHVATRHFRRYKRFLTVRLPRTPSIVHWTYPLPIRVHGAKNIYTLHDIVPLKLPYTTLDNKRYYYRLIRQCVDHGDHICTVSERSRADIMDMFGVQESKITNTYQSVHIPSSAINKPLEDVAADIRGTFNLEYGRYFLYFGAIEPKKNVGRLIEAFLTSGIETTLVLVGGHAWKSEQELRLLGAREGMSSLGKRIRCIDYVPSSLLMSLIRGAKAVVFPSLYEGFGLPVLEAMMLGTPTMTSREGATGEVAGEASLLVDPYSVADIAEALRRLDVDASLRSYLSAAGRERAIQFSQQVYANNLERMYCKVLGI